METKWTKQSYLLKRTKLAVRILKFFEMVPVTDAAMASQFLGITEKSAYVMCLKQGLNLPKINVRKDKRTLFFLTEEYASNTIMPFFKHQLLHSNFDSYILNAMPLGALVESGKKKNYLLKHDFQVSRLLLTLLKGVESVNFSPVSIRIATQYGNVEPDIITYQLDDEQQYRVLPMLFEIVNSPHNVNEYFFYLFMKYMEIAKESGSLFAYVVFADDVPHNISSIVKSFQTAFKDMHCTFKKKQFAYILSAGSLHVYVLDMAKTAAYSSVFTSTVESECKYVASKKQQIQPILSTKQHIKRIELSFNKKLSLALQ